MVTMIAVTCYLAALVGCAKGARRGSLLCGAALVGLAGPVGAVIADAVRS